MVNFRFAVLVLLVVQAFSAFDRSVAAQMSEAQKKQSSHVEPSKYFSDLLVELRKRWPNNRTVRMVFHGHSVPAGYFRGGFVRRFDSYPILFNQLICESYPTAVIDVCVTATGGEGSVAGAKRFEQDVLALKPDVVFIDYSLNDRSAGLEASNQSWRTMIGKAVESDVKVVLLTPTPDSTENILDANTPLALHADQVRRLGKEFSVPVVDSYEKFRELVAAGDDIETYLSQANHPNRPGHEQVAELLAGLFKQQSQTDK